VGETVWTILLCADVANGTGTKCEHIVLVLMPRQGVRYVGERVSLRAGG